MLQIKDGSGEFSGINQITNEVIIEVDPMYFWPTEVEVLIGNPSKAKDRLGWKPKIGIRELIKMMVESDLIEAEHEAMCLKEGYPYNEIRKQNLYSWS